MESRKSARNTILTSYFKWKCITCPYLDKLSTFNVVQTFQLKLISRMSHQSSFLYQNCNACLFTILLLCYTSTEIDYSFTMRLYNIFPCTPSVCTNVSFHPGFSLRKQNYWFKNSEIGRCAAYSIHHFQFDSLIKFSILCGYVCISSFFLNIRSLNAHGHYCDR